jgi:hypothetical protein
MKAKTLTVVCSYNGSSEALSISKNFYTSNVGGSPWFISSSDRIASSISSILSSLLISSSSSTIDAVLWWIISPWCVHTLIKSSRECTINKFMSLVHPFSCVSPTFLSTTVHPPTALISHSRGKIYIHSIKMHHKYHTSIDIPVLHMSIGKKVINPPKNGRQSMDLWWATRPNEIPAT